jgi:phosphoglucosamine mutase
MSNLGFERFLTNKGLTLHRASVGDKHVSEMMRDRGCNIGGEQSGHIVLSDYCTTGDGLIAALQVLSVIQERRQKASQVLSVFKAVPQYLRNIRLEKTLDASHPLIQDAVYKAEATLGDKGKILVRASGTEPLLRLMAQGDNENLLNRLLDDLENVVRSVE